MVLFNYQRREITGKIVYYGPGLCGKTSNLQFIHDHVDPTDRGHMVSLATDADRTLFFDFMPVDAGYIKGMKIKFQFYTVPGQVHYNETRKMVLRGADAIVFVADSQKSLLDANIYSYENMIENLKENGLDYETIPLVIQYNKRDLSDILSVKELEEKLNLRNVPNFEAVAIKGNGVMETFREIGRILLIDVGKKYRVEITAERTKQKPERSHKPETSAGVAPVVTARQQQQVEEPVPEKDAVAADVSDSYDFGDELVLDDEPHPDSFLPESLSLPDDDPLPLERSEPDPSRLTTAATVMPAQPAAPKKKPERPSIRDIEFQMDLKIIMQRLKKIIEENIDIMEKQAKIMRSIEEIREDLSNLQKGK